MGSITKKVQFYNRHGRKTHCLEVEGVDMHAIHMYCQEYIEAFLSDWSYYSIDGETYYG